MKAKPLFLIAMSISVVILIVIIATITSRYQIKIYPGNEKLCNVKKIVTSDKAPPGRDKYL
ncbi:MAG: hypothetical protein KDF65_09025, partial [Anaerolineae bacterium]|nr:hypothetical protein [Anaerolineae bacterium]